MKDELFADLLASAEEMVRIEKGEQMPMEQHVHTFSEIDVKAIREATGLKQQDFAAAVGVSYEFGYKLGNETTSPNRCSQKAAFIASG
ncbi:transcriptional regulator [Klebsiella pneumoniae]|uniref:Transcriptional regulator n=1 Tax=Klebsiella pneumoniae TaxID=573 RepID=A0A2X3IXP9_KLEPN|nr:transcriptional regulator [Klebsiella pneumoniae]